MARWRAIDFVLGLEAFEGLLRLSVERLGACLVGVFGVVVGAQGILAAKEHT